MATIHNNTAAIPMRTRRVGDIYDHRSPDGQERQRADMPRVLGKVAQGELLSFAKQKAVIYEKPLLSRKEGRRYRPSGRVVRGTTREEPRSEDQGSSESQGSEYREPSYSRTNDGTAQPEP